MSSSDPVLQRRALPPGRQLRIVLVVAALAGAVLVAAWSALGASAAQQGDAAQNTAAQELRLTAKQMATLGMAAVALRTFRSEQLTEGRIALNGDSTTQVFSPYSGRVVSVLAAPGESVKKGAPLLRIEASEYVQSRTDLINAAATLQLARTTEGRRHASFEGQGGSLQDWQQAQADLSAAQTAYAAARNRARILGMSDGQIAAMQIPGAAQASQAHAVAVVEAPIAGVITDRQVGPGQFLQAGGSTPVFTVGDLSSVWLVAEVREADAPLVERGQDIEVRVLALPGRVIKAKLTAVAAQIDPVTRRLAVRATIANPDGQLKPNMFADFSIITSGESQAPAIPQEAVIRDGQQARVWVVRDAGTLVLRLIRTGRVSEGMVEILDGVGAGEKVVTHGSLFVDQAARPG